jgi:HAD superfamily hydrolase (TIGR01509 family)
MTPLPKLRAVIFDFDGLLVNSEIVWEQVERDLLHRHGAAYDQVIMSRYIGTGLSDWTVAMVREYGLTVTPQRFGEELLELIIPALAELAEPMPGAAETIAAVQAWGGMVAIASSSNRSIVDPIVHRFGWDSIIPIRCTGDEVANTKPAPDLFLLAAQRLGVDPADCLVLEDSLNGARAALSAGMTCIAVPNPAYQPSDFEAITPHIIPSLTTLTIRDWLV